MRAESQSLARAKLMARGPRVALVTACGLLSLAGLRAAVLPPAPVRASAPVVAVPPPASAAFAEAFARDYLTFTAEDDGARERRLSAYLADDLDDDGGLVPAAGSSQRVLFTAAAVPRAAEQKGRWEVPVMAALDSGRTLTVLVRIAAGPGGALTVTDYPTLSALAARSTTPADKYGQQPTDPDLERVVTRAVRNYLAGAGQDLAADLAPRARVTTPDMPSRLRTIDQISWQAEPVSLAVLASTEFADGTRIQTRLYLTVTQQTRWFITAINPTKGTP